MSFSVVATREKDGVYFSAVPYQWVENSILFWPEDVMYSQRECLRSNANSTPNVTEWAQYPCIIKQDKIPSFSQALKIEKELSRCLDTDAEETLLLDMKKKRSQKKNSNENNFPDRNQLFEQQLSLQQIQEDFPPSEESSSTDFMLNTNNEANSYIVVASQPAVGNSNLDDCNELHEMVKDLSLVKDELTQMKLEMRSEFKKIIIHLDKVQKMLTLRDEPIIQVSQRPEEDYLARFNFPISSCDELTAFDDDIKTKKPFRDQLVTFLTRIGGTSGEENGTKIGYKLADYVFQCDLLTNYSWTGITRGNAGHEKKPFLNLEGVIDVFYTVLQKADSRFTRQKTSNFFKDGILKHAKKRSLRKRNEKPMEGEQIIAEKIDDPLQASDHDEQNNRA